MSTSGTRLVDRYKFVKGLPPTTPSSSTSAWVDLEYATHVTVLINVLNTSGSVTGSAITLNAATNISGSGSTQYTGWSTYFSNLAAGTSDAFTAQTATSGTFTTLTTASASAQYIIEINATDLLLLPTAGTYTCLQVALATGANTTVSVDFIVSGLRDGGNVAQNPSAVI